MKLFKVKIVTQENMKLLYIYLSWQPKKWLQHVGGGKEKGGCKQGGVCVCVYSSEICMFHS